MVYKNVATALNEDLLYLEEKCLLAEEVGKLIFAADAETASSSCRLLTILMF
jgi:hypothetical protein